MKRVASKGHCIWTDTSGVTCNKLQPVILCAGVCVRCYVATLWICIPGHFRSLHSILYCDASKLCRILTWAEFEIFRRFIKSLFIFEIHVAMLSVARIVGLLLREELLRIYTAIHWYPNRGTIPKFFCSGRGKRKTVRKKHVCRSEFEAVESLEFWR